MKRMRRKKEPGPIAARAPPWPPSGRRSGYESAEDEAEGEGVVVRIDVGDVVRVEVTRVDSCEMLESNLV